MKKRLLPFLFSLCVAGMSTQAEVIENYEYNFDDPGISATSYHPLGWGRNSDSGVYSMDENGRTGMCLTGEQKEDTDYWYDLIVTPPFTGTASVWVRANAADATIKFRVVNSKSTNRTDWWDTNPITDFTTPELEEGEWVKVDLPPCGEGKRIGIRLHHASIDDFFAPSADISAYQALKIDKVTRVGSGSLYGNSNDKFEFEYDIVLSNAGEVDYSPGDENYSLTHYFGSSLENIGVIDIPEEIKAGESKTIRIQALLNGWNTRKQDYLKIGENISNTMMSGSGLYMTYIPYVPELTLLVTGTTKEYKSSPYKTSEPYAPYFTFGVVDVASRNEKTFTIKNTASAAPLTLTGINVTGEGFVSDFAENVVINAGESQDFTIKFNGTEPGIYRGTFTITSSELDDINGSLSAAVPSSEVWHEGFEGDGNPEGFILSEQCELSAMPAVFEADGHKKVLKVGSTNGYFITPKVEVSEGETLLISGYSGYNDATFKVEYSADREDWTEAYATQSATFENKFSYDEYADYEHLMSFVSVEGIPAGEWYVRISGTYFTFDDLYGFKALPLGKELYLRSTILPTAGTVNNAYTATVEVSNVGSEISADEYTVYLYFGEEVFATAEPIALAPGESHTFSFGAIPHDAGSVEAKVAVEINDVTIESDVVTVTIGEESATSGVIVIGSNPGTTGSMGALYNSGYASKSRTEVIYTADYIGKYSTELASGSKIASLTQYGRNTGSAITANVKVYMKNTTNAKLGLGSDNYTPIFNDAEEMELVYDGEVTVPVQSGGELFTITLATPFSYSGSGIDILVESEMAEKTAIYYYSDRVSSNGCTVYNTNDTFDSDYNFSSSNIPTIGFGLKADVAVVSGKVTHAVSGNSLADVAITLESPENVIYKGVTDENGEYSINVLQPDKQYKVKASKDQLDDYESPEYLDLSDMAATHHFTMTGVETGISMIDAAGVSVKVVTGGIVVKSDEAIDVVIFDLLGRKMVEIIGFTSERKINLNSGIYIVNNSKVMVK